MKKIYRVVPSPRVPLCIETHVVELWLIAIRQRPLALALAPQITVSELVSSMPRDRCHPGRCRPPLVFLTQQLIFPSPLLLTFHLPIVLQLLLNVCSYNIICVLYLGCAKRKYRAAYRSLSKTKAWPSGYQKLSSRQKQ